MTRDYLLAYLATVDCSLENEVRENLQPLRNDVNGLTTFFPNEDPLTLRTYCRIFHELKVDPPKEHGFDSDYAVFTSFLD